MKTFTRLGSSLLTGSLLAACAPAATTPKPITYQADIGEIAQAIREVSSAFENLPRFESLVLVPDRSTNGQVFLTSPIRVTERGQVVNALNVLDERELIFLLTGKDGQTKLDYRMKGQLDRQLKTVLDALDKRFERVNVP